MKPSTLVLALLCFALAPAHAAPADEPEGPGQSSWVAPTPMHGRIASVLRASRGDEPVSHEECVGRIAELGPDAVAPLVEIVLRARVPGVEPGDAPQMLSSAQRDILLAALERLPKLKARQVLRPTFASAGEDEGARLGMIRILGAMGDGRDLHLLAGLAPRRAPDDLALPRESREALRLACAAILARDPRAWTTLTSVLRSTDDHAARALLSGLEQRRDPRALGMLYSVARHRPAVMTAAVAMVAVCGSSTDPELDREVVAWMLNELNTADREATRTILRALGALDDGQAVPKLIELLASEEPAEREPALAALQRISGFGFGGDTTVWNAWYADELRWSELERPRCRDMLGSGSPAMVVDALRAYGGRRLWRSELANEVAQVLDRPDADMRRIACETLRQIGSLAAVPSLTSALQDPDSSVADAAFEALRSICGIDLPRDAELVRELLKAS